MSIAIIRAFVRNLGCAHPRNAWQGALLVGRWAPAADLFQRVVLKERPTVNISGGLLSVTVVVIVIGLAGAHAGAFLRKGIASAVTHAG